MRFVSVPYDGADEVQAVTFYMNDTFVLSTDCTEASPLSAYAVFQTRTETNSPNLNSEKKYKENK